MPIRRQITTFVLVAVAMQAALGFAPGLCYSGDSVCHMFSYSIFRGTCADSEETTTCGPRSCCDHSGERMGHASGRHQCAYRSPQPEEACNDLPAAWAILLEGPAPTCPFSQALTMASFAPRHTLCAPNHGPLIAPSRHDRLRQRTAPPFLQVFII